MLARPRKRKPVAAPSPDAMAPLGAEESPPAEASDWMPPEPADTTARPPGVSIGRSRRSPKGKAIESARGSHR
jgi:hypothetical protein